MLEWVAALALAGATTFTESMAGQAWQSTRGALARILGRGSTEREQLALVRLDESAAEVVRASEGDGAEEGDEAVVLGRVVGRWETRLQDFLEEHPDAREELAALVSQTLAALPEERAARVTQTLSRNTIKGDAIVIGSAGRDITIGGKP